jgi:hypothetical protein
LRTQVPILHPKSFEWVAPRRRHPELTKAVRVLDGGNPIQ